LVDFSRVFVVLIWFWYGFDTVLIRVWYDFDMILIWFWFGFRTGASFLGLRWVGCKKGKNNSPGTGFWSMSQGLLWFWYDFDMILIWFWCGFDTILGRFWCDSDLILICFRVIFTLLTDIKITMLTHVMSKS
jgi:hypothetical protein